MLFRSGMRGTLLLGEASVEKYRLIAVVVGLVVFATLLWTLTRTKIGLLIRAGVQDREMVESLGYLCYLHEARHEVAKAVKRPRFDNGCVVRVPVPIVQCDQKLLNLRRIEGGALEDGCHGGKGQKG